MIEAKQQSRSPKRRSIITKAISQDGCVSMGATGIMEIEKVRKS